MSLEGYFVQPSWNGWYVCKSDQFGYAIKLEWFKDRDSARRRADELNSNPSKTITTF